MDRCALESGPSCQASSARPVSGRNPGRATWRLGPRRASGAVDLLWTVPERTDGLRVEKNRQPVVGEESPWRRFDPTREEGDACPRFDAAFVDNQVLRCFVRAVGFPPMKPLCSSPTTVFELRRDPIASFEPRGESGLPINHRRRTLLVLISTTERRGCKSSRRRWTRDRHGQAGRHRLQPGGVRRRKDSPDTEL